MSETKMKTMTKVNHEIPSISIVRRTIQVKQGDNAIYMTKNDVNLLRMLLEGQFDGSCYSNVEPRTRYVVMSDGGILATCKDDSHNDVVYLSPKTIKWITKFRDDNRPRLAWDRDFLRRRF